MIIPVTYRIKRTSSDVFLILEWVESHNYVKSFEPWVSAFLHIKYKEEKQVTIKLEREKVRLNKRFHIHIYERLTAAEIN